MSTYDDDFFEKKRDWSRIKDQILGNYLPVYINKIKDRDCPIVLIDGYAGPGKFDDGSIGSPLMMCSAAEKYAKGNYSAHFFNIEQKHHDKLQAIIKAAGWSPAACCYQEDSLKRIKEIPQDYKKHSIFLYLDPFGLKGCGFDQLEPYLTRSSEYSTEIVLTMCMPVVHRLATPNVVNKGQTNRRIESFHRSLSSVFGGDYWKSVLYQQNVEPEAKEFQLMDAYLAKLRQYRPYVGCCPVRKQSDERIKYFMIFISGHPDAMLKMNDIMHKAYFSSMHVADNRGTLYELLDWKEMPSKEMSSLEGRNQGTLKRIITELVAQYPGETRDGIWLKLIQAHFMSYDAPLYKDTLKQLLKEKRIIYNVDPQTKKHNGKCKLFPV